MISIVSYKGPSNGWFTITLNDLKGRFEPWICILGFDNLGVKPLTDLLRNGSAINLGGRHCDWSAGESPLLGGVLEREKGGRSCDTNGVVES